MKNLLLLLLLSFFELRVDAAPPNDLFENATILSGLSDSSGGTTIDATRELLEPNSTQYRTVWYRWQAPTDGRATISLIPTDSSPKYWNFSIWGGSPINDLAYCGHLYSLRDSTSFTDLPIAAGTTLSFCVGHQFQGSGTGGTFTIQINHTGGADFTSQNVVESTWENTLFNSATTLLGDDSTGISYSAAARACKISSVKARS